MVAGVEGLGGLVYGGEKVGEHGANLLSFGSRQFFWSRGGLFFYAEAEGEVGGGEDDVAGGFEVEVGRGERDKGGFV